MPCTSTSELGTRVNPNLDWLIWLAVTLVSFGIMEGIAIACHKYEWTLSATLRRWLGVDPKRRWRLLASAAFLGFFVWFCIHILT